MGAVPERHVAAVGPGDVEGVGGGTGPAVAVGRQVDHHHRLARADGVAAQLQVAGGEAERQHRHRRAVAQALLHRPLPRHRAGGDQGELVGMLQQQPHGVGDLPDRGLVARVDEQDHRPDELLLRQPGAVLVVDPQQGADQPLVRALPLGRHHVGDVGVQLLVHRGVGARQQAGDQGVEGFPVRFGNPQQAAEDARGHRTGQGRDDVERPRGVDAVQAGPGEVAHRRAQCLDPAGGERVLDEAAQPGVLGRVLAEHRPHGDQLHQRVPGGDLPPGHGRPVLAPAFHRGVGHERPQLLVAGHGPHVQTHHIEPDHGTQKSQGANVVLGDTAVGVEHDPGWGSQGDSLLRERDNRGSPTPLESVPAPAGDSAARSTPLRGRPCARTAAG